MTRRTGSGFRNIQKLVVVGLGGLIGLGLGGCASTGGGNEDALLRENRELRDRVIAQQGALDSASARIAALEDENGRIAANTRETGFGNIKGVSTSVNAKGEVVVAIAGDVLFASGKVDLKNASKSTLDRVAGVLNSTYANNSIRIEGYTDSDPIKKSKWGTNERLSAERALAVETYLVKKGIKNDRVYSAAFGTAKSKPTKQASRRVEIVILAS
jgi:chemotaxis protein MotB